MKIVHVSNFTMKWNGEHYFSIPYKLNNGFTRLGHNVFSVCDRDLADRYFLGVRIAGRGYANRKILAICEEIRPDLVLLGHCTLVTPQTVLSVRKMLPDVRIAHWNCDPLFFPNNMARLKILAPLVDATFVTTAGPLMEGIAEAGGRVAFMPNPVDKSIETLRAFDNEHSDIDLLFMGTPIEERVALCRTVRKAIPELRFETRGFDGAPPIFGARLMELLGRSKMGLALSRRDDVFLYASDRMSMMVGNGLLTFIDGRSGFHRIFAPDELVTFANADDLVTKVRVFTNDDSGRRSVARAGWRRIHELFSETRIAGWIENFCYAKSDSPIPDWLEGIRA